MEILSSSRRGYAGEDSPASAIGSGSASKYKSRLDNRSNKLSFYQSAPPLEVSLEDFELFAVDRLRVLKGLEDALSRGKKIGRTGKLGERVVEKTHADSKCS